MLRDTPGTREGPIYLPLACTLSLYAPTYHSRREEKETDEGYSPAPTRVEECVEDDSCMAAGAGEWEVLCDVLVGVEACRGRGRGDGSLWTEAGEWNWLVAR